MEMQKILKNIDKYKHIVIIVPENSFLGYLASANALFTYLLQQHKKVSLYKQSTNFDLNLKFLPWIDKVKSSYPSSCDVEIKAISSKKLFDYFQENNIKLNVKMATSLYAGLLYETNGFKKDLDITTFVMAQKLLEFKADIEICTNNILNYQKLSSLRLKAILLKKMILKDDATLAVFELNDDDLKMSGANVNDAQIVISEALSLITVEKVIIIYKNNIIKESM